MRSVNFWHQQDANSLFKEALVMLPLSVGGLLISGMMHTVLLHYPISQDSFKNFVL